MAGEAPERLAGVAVPLFSLRSNADHGIGEIFDLVPFADWAVEAGQRIIALLPLGELAPGETSPYNALSSFAIDPLHLTLAEVPELAGVAAVASPPALADAHRLDRERVRAWKAPLLAEAFARFRRLPEGDARVREYHGFGRDNAAWLDDYALFRALGEEQGFASWKEWPAALRRRDARALERARAEHAGRIDLHRYLQFAAEEQWWRVREHAARRGVRLMGDLPFAPSENSADVWAGPEVFDLARSVGAPPDEFSATGQRWGLPMYRWKRLRRDGWDWFRRRFRRMADLYDLYRIDHVVGLFRTWCFRGERADGAFDPAAPAAQEAQGRELLAVACAESGAASIVAEDLGLIPDFVRRAMADLGIPGYKVLRWERRERRLIDPRDYPQCSVATTGTHDTDSLVAWWAGMEATQRAELVRLVPGRQRRGPVADLDPDLRLALLDCLYESGSRYVILPIQDLFGWPQRINLPATIDPSNWSFRMPVTIEELSSDHALAAVGKRLRASIDAAGRLGRMTGAPTPGAADRWKGEAS